MTTRRFLVLPLVACLLTACVNDSRGPAPEEPPAPSQTLDAALEQAVDSAVIPAVAEFAAASQALDDAANAFCGNLSEANLEEVQAQWRTAFTRWYRLALYNFGPLDDDIVFPPYTFIDSLRLRGTDYTETVRDDIVSDIESSQTLDDAYFGSKTFQRLGLLALEVAVFETSSAERSTVASDIVAEFGFQPRKCEVLQGLSGQLLARAQYVEQGWTTAFREGEPAYRSLFLGAQLEDGTAPVNQLIISAQEFLDYLQARNVVITAAQISVYSWEAISATVDEVELLLNGGAQTTASLFDVMIATGNQNAVDSVNNSIAEVRQAISARDPAMLEVALGFLDGNFKREIPDSLNVELGINFSDGD